MKNQLINAINYMESINVDLKAFYSISTNFTGTTFQGNFDRHTNMLLKQNGFHFEVVDSGFIYLRKDLEFTSITVAFT